MKKRGMVGMGFALALTVLAAGALFGQSDMQGRSDLCGQMDMKPVLSLDQVNQSELVHLMVILSGNTPPAPEGMSPEEYYDAEVKMLLDGGYPSAIAGIPGNTTVKREYFASVMFQLAVQNDPQFALKYGNLTDQTEQLQALTDSNWIYAEEGNIYKEEILAVLCNNPIGTKEVPGAAIEILPEDIKEANLESERSGI